MKRFILATLCAVPAFCMGQVLLYCDGATIKVQAGATLYVEGGIQNTATGIIDNDGIIEVRGDFINAGSWEPTQPNTLKFSGNLNSNVTSGPAQFQTVVIQKDATFNVNLVDNMTVNTNLNFNAAGSSKINLGNFDLTLGGSATTTGYDSDEFVVTGGTGKMKKVFTALTNFTYPVGFNATTYNPATLNVTAGPNDTYSVRVLGSPTDGNGMTGTPITTDVVDAVWDIQETTVGGNTVDVTLGWAETDELTGFDDLLNCVSKNDGVNGWDALFTQLGPEVSNTRTRTGLTSFSAFAVGDEPIGNALVLAPKVFLQGPYSGTQMTDLLRTLALLPITEPYAAAPFNYVHVGYGGGEAVPSAATFDQTGTNDDIVDWVVMEIRDATTPATRLATKSALIQRDGNIVDLDGLSALKVYGLGDGTYHVSIRHRNHLTVRTATSLLLNNTSSTLDFSVLGYAYDNGSSVNEPMVNLGSGVQGMWTGDASGDKKVRVTPLATPPFTPSDRSFMLNNALGGNPNGQLNAYDRSDINLDGKVRVTPLATPPFTPSDATITLNSVLGGDPNKTVSEHN